MNKTMELFKMTWKNLIRSKGFVFFAILVPILATLILNINDTADNVIQDKEINELEKSDTQIAYLIDNNMEAVKVYDSSMSEASDRYLKNLYKTGMFQIFRVNAAKMSETEIKASCEKTINNDRARAILIIDSDFGKNNENNDTKALIQIISVGDDERTNLLENYSNAILSVPEYEVQSADIVEVNLTTSHDEAGLEVDYDKTGILGNALAILSMAFAMTGIFILGTIIFEKNNRIYTRIMLTNATRINYLLSKLMVICITSVMQTVMACISMKLFVRRSMDITVFEYALIVFCMSLIFNSISVCIGLFTNSVSTATYITFMVWVSSALLGGLYFDIANATDTYKRFTMVIPQRWGLKAAKMFIDGNNNANILMLAVTFSFLLVIIVASMIGLRVSKKN